MSEKMIKGMDIGSLPEEERHGARFFDHGEEGDALEILKRYGTNYVRLRLWNDPYDRGGRPYGGGNCDLDCVTALALRAKALGMGVLLDLQYSDHWADPGKQTTPKAWQGLQGGALETAVLTYTAGVMEELARRGAAPAMVQVGNELTNGLLWPEAKRPHFDRIAACVSAGIRGLKSVDPDVPVMIHLDNGGNNAMYREWFDAYCGSGEDFQIIGLSYYPFWHGTLDELSFNMKDMARRYGKKIVVAEVSTGFSLEDYRPREVPPEVEEERREEWIRKNLKGYAAGPALAAKIPWPMTPRGQSDFMEEFLKRVRAEEQALGFFYWEPAWIPVPGVGWSTQEGVDYTGETGPFGNEWANQALFDYDGNALPALEVIRDW